MVRREVAARTTAALSSSYDADAKTGRWTEGVLYRTLLIARELQRWRLTTNAGLIF